MRKFLLEHNCSPGDVAVLTALVRDINLTYPNQYSISVSTKCPDLWLNNPYVSPKEADSSHIKADYGHALNLLDKRKQHFLLSFHEDFEKKTGIHVPLLYPKPDIHLTEEEKKHPLISGRYWVIVAGGKSDVVTKHWIYKRHQQVVNILRGFGLHFVQVGAIAKNPKIGTFHFHPRLENTLNLVGLTTIRDLLRIIYHSDGVICGITAAMHLAAAFDKPCVCISGGREEWWWPSYVNGLGNLGKDLKEPIKVPHKFLHTIGKLECCKTRGCWTNAVEGKVRICKIPLQISGQIAPACMDMIKVEHVIEAVMSYYEDGIIPPISEPKRIVFIDGKPVILEKDAIYSKSEESELMRAVNMIAPKLILPTKKITELANLA